MYRNSNRFRILLAVAVLLSLTVGMVAAREPLSVFDLNGNGRIDFADIVKLFGEI